MPAKPLTPRQLEDAARLKKIFLAWQKRQEALGMPSSQEVAVEKLGFNQSAFSQYLNGKIPLNIDVAIRFANFLGCAVGDFSEAIVEQVAEYAAAVGITRPTVQASSSNSDGDLGKLDALVALGAIGDDEAVVLRQYRLSSDDGKKHIRHMATIAERRPLVVANDKSKLGLARERV